MKYINAKQRTRIAPDALFCFVGFTLSVKTFSVLPSLPECRTVKVAAGKTAVIVTLRQAYPNTGSSKPNISPPRLPIAAPRPLKRKKGGRINPAAPQGKKCHSISNIFFWSSYSVIFFFLRIFPIIIARIAPAMIMPRIFKAAAVSPSGFSCFCSLSFIPEISSSICCIFSA